MLVKDFKEQQGYRFDERFLDLLPDICIDDECDSPTQMTETLTSLQCSNPRCPAKVRMRLLALSRSIGVKGVGTEKARGFVSKFGITNPLAVFAYEPHIDGEWDYSTSMRISENLYSEFSKRKRFTLPEYVQVAHLPFIQSSATHIFSGYSSLEEAYKDIEDGGVEFIRSKLGISKGAKSILEVENSEDYAESISIRALKIYESLMTFKDDLLDIVKFVDIIDLTNSSIKTFKAVCSDEVGPPFKTKRDFYVAVNNLYGEKIHIEFLNSVNKSIDFLIWAGADGVTPARLTNKVKKVRDYNEKYERTSTGKEIPILTAAQFISHLDKLSGQGVSHE